MARLKDNLDLLAILVLIAVLGIGRAPMLRPSLQTIRMERPVEKFRLHRLDRLSRLDRFSHLDRLSRLDRVARHIPFIR